MDVSRKMGIFGAVAERVIFSGGGAGDKHDLWIRSVCYFGARV
jgi:hypothetical protein